MIANKEADEVPWTWRGTLNIVHEEEVPSWAVAYVYVITHHIPGKSAKIYIGKKHLTTKRRSKIGVREKASTGTRKRFKTVTKVSNWQKYWGSSKSLLEARKSGIGTWSRAIIEWCHSKKHATYCELKNQFHNRVLEIDSYNDNINGSIYRRDIVNHQ